MGGGPFAPITGGRISEIVNQEAESYFFKRRHISKYFFCSFSRVSKYQLNLNPFHLYQDKNGEENCVKPVIESMQLLNQCFLPEI